jgi:hypothetical protein
VWVGCILILVMGRRNKGENKQCGGASEWQTPRDGAAHRPQIANHPTLASHTTPLFPPKASRDRAGDSPSLKPADFFGGILRSLND